MKKMNSRLSKLVEAWRQEGCPPQEAFPWQRSKPQWSKLAREFDLRIDDYPEFIDRSFLWGLSEHSHQVESTYLAIMIWGYGDIGYGPHRVRQMFSSEGFACSIRHVKNLCEANEPIGAYKALKGFQIRQLGPSFGSKVITFFHTRCSAPPILDSVVGKWLSLNTTDLFSSTIAETWNVEAYSRYINWMKDRSAEFELPPSTLEQLIFADGYRS